MLQCLWSYLFVICELGRTTPLFRKDHLIEVRILRTLWLNTVHSSLACTLRRSCGTVVACSRRPVTATVRLAVLVSYFICPVLLGQQANSTERKFEQKLF